MALADDSSPVFIAGAMNAFGSVFKDFEKVAAALRGDGGRRGATTTPACSRARKMTQLSHPRADAAV